MFRKMKKAIVLIPCMIFAFFLFNATKAMAADAKLMDAEVVTIGTSSKENTYYFTKDTVWEFKASFSAIKEWDTFLKWRVVRPDGKATEWSDKDYYVDNDGKFVIGNYKNLAYTAADDKASSRFSVVPENTYYVDIEYYGQLILSWKQDKDETIKVVVAGDASLMTPLASINYDSANNQFSISADFAQSGYSLISSVQYLFASSSTVVTDAKEFRSAYGDKTITNKNTVTVNADTYVATIDEDNTADTLYVLVSTPHGYEVLVSYDMTSSQGGNSVPQTPDTNGQQNANTSDDDKGLFDYDFGQLILIVLVVVLVVSCALIITQKIVDYKKRLY